MDTVLIISLVALITLAIVSQQQRRIQKFKRRKEQDFQGTPEPPFKTPHQDEYGERPSNYTVLAKPEEVESPPGDPSATKDGPGSRPT